MTRRPSYDPTRDWMIHRSKQILAVLAGCALLGAGLMWLTLHGVYVGANFIAGAAVLCALWPKSRGRR